MTTRRNTGARVFFFRQNPYFYGKTQRWQRWPPRRSDYAMDQKNVPGMVAEANFPQRLS